jgi:cysteine-rich repeat protein
MGFKRIRYYSIVTALQLGLASLCWGAGGGIEPPNDGCSEALLITDGDTAFSTIDATTDGTAHPSCGPGSGQTYADVWFDYIATCTGDVTVSTCGAADFDTDVVIYSDGGSDCGVLPCPPGAVELVACNDDAAGCAGLTSEATTPVSQGNCYRIRVGGFDAPEHQGSGVLTVQCVPPDCGDGVTDPGEDCDDSGESMTCDDDCSAVLCGDGNVNQAAGEDCDTAGDSASCDSDCTVAQCGDGTLNPAASEQCDDGNTTVGDGCDAVCRNELPGSCSVADECCDLDDDGTIDDVCSWCSCDGAPAGTCSLVQTTLPSDIGGQFGVCPPDSFCNIHDRSHALSCFAGTATCDDINLDAGGAFGACVADGECNIHDANAALVCFNGESTCLCGPAPQAPVSVVGSAALQLQGANRARPGQFVEVRVFVESEAAGLQAFQLELEVSGGRRGRLTLVDVGIESRRDFIFAGRVDRFVATNISGAKMLCGLESGDSVRTSGYMATFTYEVSTDAAGQFMIQPLLDPTGSRTCVISQFTDEIEVQHTQPLIIDIHSLTRSRDRKEGP